MAPRRRFLVDELEFAVSCACGRLASERDLVPGPSPRLAIEVAWRRISSIDDAGLSRSGSWSPKMAQGILVFMTVRFPLRDDLLLPQAVDIFIGAFLSFSR